MIYIRLPSENVSDDQFNQMVIVENNADGDPYSLEGLHATIKHSGNDNFVCVHEKKIVGFATINPYSKRFGGSIYIVNLSVHKDFQRMGVAQNIIKTACEYYSKEYHSKCITLHVSKDNVKAVGLYKKLAFEVIDDFIEDEDDYAMGITINNLKQKFIKLQDNQKL